MRRAFMLMIMLNKRLWRKPSFLVILCIVPILVAGMSLAAQGESGIMRIALCVQNPEDAVSSQILARLTRKDSVLRYLMCDTEEEAREMVADAQADAAWIFPENLEERLRERIAGGSREPAVTVVEREDSVALIFTREILSKAMYPYISYKAYEEFVRNDLGLEIDDRELREAYEATLIEESFFQMEYPDGQAGEDNSYLLAPIRGMLAVWLVLCGFAASMYYIQDEGKGVYSRVPVRRRLWAAFGVHWVLLSNAAIVLLLSCRVAGVFTSWHREVLSLFLFMCCIVAFCNLLRLLCRTPEYLGSCFPILLLGMLILCPVFIRIRQLAAVRVLLPPNYYLRSVHGDSYLYKMAVYAVVCTGLCVLTDRLQRGRILGKKS